jgi:6-phosphogluconate dehydrogenase
MGENLVLNMESHGYTVAVYNRTTSKVDEFVGGRGAGKKIVGTHTPAELVASLKSPRKIMIMVKAGKPVDDVIAEFIPLLSPGDILIDGGNSQFPDSTRRTKALKEKGLLYIGTGVSGGEEGALKGPSIMPGGNPEAWPAVKPIFQSIAAKVADGSPCCDWVGPEGAGHFVKMVHNGIEYGDMQLICEAYNIFKAAGFTAAELASVFDTWNQGELESYLIQITAEIFKQNDPQTGVPVVERILDTAGQKGTGKWTILSAADSAVVISTINAAVEARILSSMKDQRVAASTQLEGPSPAITTPKAALVQQVHAALYASKIISYAQGLELLTTMSAHKGWNLDLSKIAAIWRGGCIIRARFLKHITAAYRANPALGNLMLDPFFKDILNRSQQNWREVVALAMLNGIPVPAFSASLGYYDSCRSAVLPANLLQAQRDFFGAHTYERTDMPRGQMFHTEWPEVIG